MFVAYTAAAALIVWIASCLLEAARALLEARVRRRRKRLIEALKKMTY